MGREKGKDCIVKGREIFKEVKGLICEGKELWKGRVGVREGRGGVYK